MFSFLFLLKKPNILDDELAISNNALTSSACKVDGEKTTSIPIHEGYIFVNYGIYLHVDIIVLISECYETETEESSSQGI